MCGLSRVERKPDCVIYSFGAFHILNPSIANSTMSSTIGINYESSFEAELLANTRHCEIWGYDFSVKSFGPEISAKDLGRTHFHQYGLSGTDGKSDEGYMFYTLETLMKMNGMRIDHHPWRHHELCLFRTHAYRYPQD